MFVRSLGARRLGFAVSTISLAAIGWAPVTGIAHATTASRARVTLSKSSVTVDSTVKISGSGFGTRALVRVYFSGSRVATVRARSSGRIGPAAITVPVSAAAGRHKVTIRGSTPVRSASAWLTVPADGTDWPQSRFGAAEDGDNTTENRLSAADVKLLHLQWKYAAGAAIDQPPIVADGIVYIAPENYSIELLKASNGHALWPFYDAGQQSDLPAPAVSGDMMYAGSAGYFYAVNQVADAPILWRTETDPLAPYTDLDSPATLSGSDVYFTSADGDLHALDAATGDQLWTFTAPTAFNFSPPAVVDGTVYVADSDGNLYAIDAATGAVTWTLPLGSTVVSPPAIANGIVYVGAGNGTLYAVSAATGTQLWQYSTGSPITAASALAAGTVYVPSQGGVLTAVDAATGKKIWSYQADSEGLDAPAVADGVIYIGSADKKIYALSASSGQRLWSYTTGGVVNGSPVVANGHLYVGSDDGYLYAFELK